LVVEKTVPDGYSVSVSRNSNTFTVTNTGKKKTTIKKSSGGNDDTNDSDDDDNDNTVTTTNSEDNTTPGPTETTKQNKVPRLRAGLPQTGQLWWPVCLFACVGLVLLVIGIHLRKRSEE
jgi:hypothetical protein